MQRGLQGNVQSIHLSPKDLREDDFTSDLRSCGVTWWDPAFDDAKRLEQARTRAASRIGGREEEFPQAKCQSLNRCLKMLLEGTKCGKCAAAKLVRT